MNKNTVFYISEGGRLFTSDSPFLTKQSSCIEGVVTLFNNLKQVPTSELVAELQRREGVHAFIAGPYQEYDVYVLTNTDHEGLTHDRKGKAGVGPAIIMVVTD